MEYKLVGYSTQTCSLCNGSRKDPKYNPYSDFYIKSLDYCPHCQGQGTIQINYFSPLDNKGEKE